MDICLYLEGRERNTTSRATSGFTENIRIISDPSYNFYFVRCIVGLLTEGSCHFGSTPTFRASLTVQTATDYM